MIVDASALIAILFEEPEAGHFSALIAKAPRRRISAVNLLEAGIRADHSSNPKLGAALDALVAELELEIAPLSENDVALARKAYLRYGRGNHPARLNFGDCVAYALAKATGEPLLFKGNDFGRTDISAV